MSDASSPVWQVVSDIVFNTWYTRLWVMQEATMAQSIIILVGDCEIDCDLLEKVLGSLAGFLSAGFESAGPAATVLRRECALRKVDITRIVQNAEFIGARSFFHENRDTEP